MYYNQFLKSVVSIKTFAFLLVSSVLGCGPSPSFQSDKFGPAQDYVKAETRDEKKVPKSMKNPEPARDSNRADQSASETKSDMVSYQPEQTENPQVDSHKAANSLEDEIHIADTPVPISGAFLTCWTHVPDALGTVPASNQGHVRVACGFLNPKGEKVLQDLPLSSWQIVTKDNGNNPQPISGIQISTSPHWSVEFFLPHGQLEKSSVVVDNVPVESTPPRTDKITFALKRSQSIASNDDSADTVLGAKKITGFLPGCPESLRKSDPPRFLGTQIPFQYSLPVPKTSPGLVAVTITDICGVNLYRPTIKLARASGALAQNSKLEVAKNAKNAPLTLQLEIPESDNYTITLEPGKFGDNDRDDFAYRGFFVIPLVGATEFGAFKNISKSP